MSVSGQLADVTPPTSLQETVAVDIPHESAVTGAESTASYALSRRSNLHWPDTSRFPLQIPDQPRRLRPRQLKAFRYHVHCDHRVDSFRSAVRPRSNRLHCLRYLRHRPQLGEKRKLRRWSNRRGLAGSPNYPRTTPSLACRSTESASYYRTKTARSGTSVGPRLGRGTLLRDSGKRSYRSSQSSDREPLLDDQGIPPIPYGHFADFDGTIPAHRWRPGDTR
jgi:hypothetical protein